MGPIAAIRTGFAKSFQFEGRATRSEFWWFAAFAALPVYLVATWLVQPWDRRSYSLSEKMLEVGWLGALICPLVCFILMLSLGMRKYRDVDVPVFLWPVLIAIAACPIVYAIVVPDIFYHPNQAFVVAIILCPIVLLCAFLFPLGPTNSRLLPESSDANEVPK
ncbi:DUF805 domain-containing protein [Yoonia sp. R2331]|uniref:DUF805 domain-containing protein n=1 Tax=Yoonia sp. R2331 TaxID=3237238 RepID=UPI0034E5A125